MYGVIDQADFKPSTAPFTKLSYISTFFKNPCIIMNNTNKGIIKFDI